jgi:hypothetical protein
MKKFQFHSNILIACDGYVLAKNIKDAKHRINEFSMRETIGMSYVDTKIYEVLSEKNKYFDKTFLPEDDSFKEENDNVVCDNYFN